MNRSSPQVISSNERDAERNEINEVLREIISAHSDDEERAASPHRFILFKWQWLPSLSTRIQFPHPIIVSGCSSWFDFILF